MIVIDDVPDPHGLWVACDVSGERRLRENRSHFSFKVADGIDAFSRYMPFEAGELIAMGAPKGVALGKPNAAELYLKPGDQMEIAFEGLMSLRTRIVAPTQETTG